MAIPRYELPSEPKLDLDSQEAKNLIRDANSYLKRQKEKLLSEESGSLGVEEDLSKAYANYEYIRGLCLVPQVGKALEHFGVLVPLGRSVNWWEANVMGAIYDEIVASSNGIVAIHHGDYGREIERPNPFPSEQLEDKFNDLVVKNFAKTSPLVAAGKFEKALAKLK